MKLDNVSISEPTFNKHGDIILQLTIPRKFKMSILTLKDKLYDAVNTINKLTCTDATMVDFGS